MKSQESIIHYQVPGARRVSNYAWGSIMILGGIAFLLTGISSYFNFAFLPLLNSPNIQFFPQGLVMCFYGFLGLTLGMYIWFIIFLNLGKGLMNLILKQDKFEFFGGVFREKIVVLIFNIQFKIFKVFVLKFKKD